MIPAPLRAMSSRLSSRCRMPYPIRQQAGHPAIFFPCECDKPVGCLSQRVMSRMVMPVSARVSPIMIVTAVQATEL